LKLSTRSNFQNRGGGKTNANSLRGDGSDSVKGLMETKGQKVRLRWRDIKSRTFPRGVTSGGASAGKQLA